MVADFNRNFDKSDKELQNIFFSLRGGDKKKVEIYLHLARFLIQLIEGEVQVRVPG